MLSLSLALNLSVRKLDPQHRRNTNRYTDSRSSRATVAVSRLFVSFNRILVSRYAHRCISSSLRYRRPIPVIYISVIIGKVSLSLSLCASPMKIYFRARRYSLPFLSFFFFLLFLSSSFSLALASTRNFSESCVIVALILRLIRTACNANVTDSRAAAVSARRRVLIRPAAGVDARPRRRDYGDDGVVFRNIDTRGGLCKQRFTKENSKQKPECLAF